MLTAVRGFVAHAVTSGQAPGELMGLIYELADESDLPAQARGEERRMAWRMRARHRLHEPEATVDRASDEEIVALLWACRSARDRLIVLLMARAGLRRGELCGLRRSDVHLLADSRLLGCAMPRAHLHVVRRDNPNGAWAKSRRQRVVPLDFLVVQVFDVYEFERFAVPRAGESDFLLVNLFREPIGAPMRPDAINELIAACSRRAGIDHPTPISRVIARGEVLRFGSSSVVMEGSLRTAAGKLLAVATATAIPRPFLPRRGVFEDPACTPWANGGTTETSLEARRLHHDPYGVLLLHGRTRERLADLEPLGLLKANDRAVLAAHCEAWSRSVAAGGPVPRRRRDQEL